MSNSFQDKLSHIGQRKGPEEIKNIETASFKYSIINGDIDNPHLFVDVDKFDESCLNALSYLLASISHENFIYHILTYIEKGFVLAHREEDFLKLLESIEVKKDKIAEDADDVYICPLKLTGG
jgi:hypothetical protein